MAKKAGFRGIDKVTGKMKQAVDKVRKDAVEEQRNAARTAMKRFFARTPVWTGETIRNYAWGIGSGASVHHEAEGGGEPGKTNEMPLGPEPRRAANEAAAWADMEAVLAKLTVLNSLMMTNSSPHFDLVDAGSAPGGPNQQIRNPGGVVMLAMQDVKSQLKKRWKGKK
jgi:hypothetical protein